jgi:hypothetical protein
MRRKMVRHSIEIARRRVALDCFIQNRQTPVSLTDAQVRPTQVDLIARDLRFSRSSLFQLGNRLAVPMQFAVQPPKIGMRREVFRISLYLLSE